MAEEVDYSIVVPAYNCRDQLERLIENLQAQDYPKEHYEILVVDDGSTDGSGDLAEKMGARVFRHEKNLGRVCARESGAREAKHENLVFVDARVVIGPEILRNASRLKHLPLMGVGASDKTRSWIDRVFYCIRRKVYRPFEPQTKYNEELWIKQDEFDGRPKGLGLFIVKRETFNKASLAEKSQDVSDDTKLLWNIVVNRDPILRHTDLIFHYEHRQNWPELLRHTYFRGPKFLDYYLTPGGPLFKAYMAGIFALLVYLGVGICFPMVFYYSLLALLTIYLGVCVWMSEDIVDVFVCAICFLPIASAFISGIVSAQFFRLLRLREMIRH